MKDPYAVLGLTQDAAPELIKQKYAELRALYGEQRFLAGEEGNEGARKLQELEEAWHVISERMELAAKTSSADPYEQIDSLIRSGKYNEAQDMLDSVSERHGEWHYLQAIVFYNREWLTEAKNQLEMAIAEEPNNAKYRSSLDKLNMTIANPKQQAQANAAANNVAPEPMPMNQADSMSNCLSTCCCAYCLTDCLCSAMRCM